VVLVVVVVVVVVRALVNGTKGFDMSSYSSSLCLVLLGMCCPTIMKKKKIGRKKSKVSHKSNQSQRVEKSRGFSLRTQRKERER